MNTINLATPITVKISDRPPVPNQPAPETRDVTISSLTPRQAIDDPVTKRVQVSFYETRFPVTIWDGDDYDKVGNWTQDQLDSAVKKAIKADASKIVTQALEFPVQSNQAHNKIIFERIKSVFPKGAPRPAWMPAVQPPAQVQAAKTTSTPK